MQPNFSFTENNNSKILIDSKENNNFSKYINFTNEEIIEKLNQKKKEIFEYYNINKSLKTELTGILEKLNSFSSKNKLHLLLNDNNLQIILNHKKLEYIKYKTSNSMLKDQYDLLLKSVKEISEKQITNVITEKKLNIDKLKEENFEIKKEIVKIQTESAKTQNEVIKIRNNNMYLQNLDLFSYKLKKYMDAKNKYIKAFNMTNKILKEKLKELDNLENIMNIKNKSFSKNEIVFNKLKQDLFRIKTDITDVTEEADKKNIYEDILILNNFAQKYLDSTNDNTFNISNRPKEKLIIKRPSLLDIHNQKICNSDKMMDLNIKLKPILRKNNSMMLLQGNPTHNQRKDLNNIKTNIKNLNRFLFHEKIINNNSIITSSTVNSAHREKNLLKKNINSFSYDFNKIKFKEMNDEIYHSLLNKKENYIEESERISRNIKEINKTFFSKYNQIVNNLKKNIDKLNEIKIINKGLQAEIKKLKDLKSEMQTEDKKIIENGGNFKKI